MKLTPKKPVPVRSTRLPWDRKADIRAMLPPENPRRGLYSAKVTALEEMPQKFTFALIDLIAEGRGLSKGKARKAIAAGKVSVNGQVVRDPDARVDGDAQVVFFS